MDLYLQEIGVDLNKRKFAHVCAKQNDIGRKILVSVYDNGVFKDMSNYTCAIKMCKPDGLQVDNMAQNENGKILIELTKQMLAVPGYANITLTFTDSTNAISIIQDISLDIEPEAIDEAQIISTDEMGLLNQKIIDITNLETTVSNNENERKTNENNRKEAEDVRVKAENSRNTNEENRKSNEESRKNEEKNRVNAENNRVIAENTRNTAENTRNTQESTRQTQESKRQDNEKARQNFESIREANENVRKQSEESRVKSENNRNTKETERQRNEEIRQSQESIRENAETERNNNESVREQSESVRNDNEKARQDAENDRHISEEARVSAETTRVQNENNRIDSEDVRLGDEDNRIESELLRMNAEKERVQNESDRLKAFEQFQLDAANEIKKLDDNENSRVDNENIRIANETKRISSESTRETSEEKRELSEKTRVNNESERIKNEDSRNTAENNRVTNESNRESAENTRKTNENNRINKEKDRQEAEKNRTTNYDKIKNDAENEIEKMQINKLEAIESANIFKVKVTEKDGAVKTSPNLLNTIVLSEVQSVSYDEKASATLSQEFGNQQLVLRLPVGKPLTISKTYKSIATMNDDIENIELYALVMISSNVEDEDNAKMFIKASNAEMKFLADLSGSQGIQGEKGDKGNTGATPILKIGTITTGEPGTFATVTINTDNPEQPVIDMVIPRGDTGKIDNIFAGNIPYSSIEDKKTIKEVIENDYLKKEYGDENIDFLQIDGSEEHFSISGRKVHDEDNFSAVSLTLKTAKDDSLDDSKNTDFSNVSGSLDLTVGNSQKYSSMIATKDGIELSGEKLTFNGNKLAPIITLTQAEYDVIGNEKLTNNVIYFISDDVKGEETQTNVRTELELNESNQLICSTGGRTFKKTTADLAIGGVRYGEMSPEHWTGAYLVSEKEEGVYTSRYRGSSGSFVYDKNNKKYYYNCEMSTGDVSYTKGENIVTLGEIPEIISAIKNGRKEYEAILDYYYKYI